MNLKGIGFYTLSDERVLNTSETSQMKRCEMIITEYCNFKCPYCRGLKTEIYGQRKIKELYIQSLVLIRLPKSWTEYHFQTFLLLF